jgi:CRISPR-associated endonuclease/helicase Cas3
LRWSGPDSDRTRVVADPGDVRPGELFILPTSAPEVAQLGDFPSLPPADVGDAAFQYSRDKAILRLTEPPLPNIPASAGLTAQDEEFDQRLSKIISSASIQDLPEKHWLKIAVEHLAKPLNRRVYEHPLGGFVVEGKKRLRIFDPTFIEAEESTEASTDEPIYLADHHRDVAERARLCAQILGLDEGQVRVLYDAGLLHDSGKADSRFQAWLHGGNWRQAAFAAKPLAKSIGSISDQASRQHACQRSGYPQGARHELVSARLAENAGTLPDDPLLRDLTLHLIASHHGYCRPFAPVVIDEKPLEIVYDYNGHKLATSSVTALECLDSGVAERFWMLTRRLGWWGLPWLESILRLADWAASQDPARQETAI